MKLFFRTSSIPLFFSVILFLSCNSTDLVSSWNEPSLSIKRFHKILVVGLTGKDESSMKQDLEMDMVDAFYYKGVDAYSAYTLYGPKAFNGKDPKKLLMEMKDTTFDAILCMVLIDKDKEKYYNAPTTNNMQGNQNYNNGNGSNYNNGNNFNNGTNNSNNGFNYNNNNNNNGNYNNNNNNNNYNNNGNYNNNNNYNNGGYYNNNNGVGNYYNNASNSVSTPGYYSTTTNYTIESDLFSIRNDSLIYYAETKSYDPSDMNKMSLDISKDIISDMLKKGVIPMNQKVPKKK
jgi:hypothetical protein